MKTCAGEELASTEMNKGMSRRRAAESILKAQKKSRGNDNRLREQMNKAGE